MDENYEDMEEEKGSEEEEVEEETNRSNHSLENDGGDDDSAGNRRTPLTRRCKFLTEDRISRLPDSIIHQILSFLPMQDAVKTGVLSKRWQYLWTSIPTINFCYYGGNYRSFFAFINKTLAQYSSSKVKKFFLSFDYSNIIFREEKEDSVFSIVGLCLRFATTHGVEDLNLVLRDCNYHLSYSIPQYLYAHSSLTNLTTKYCDLAPKAEVSWASLKVLNIGITRLTEDGFQRILSGTPLLEHLELIRCSGINSIQISSMSALKKLVIKTWEQLHVGEVLETLQISIPGVKSLELLGSWQVKCLLLDVSSLVEATLDFRLSEDEYVNIQEYEGMVEKVLQKLTLVHKLTVSNRFIRAPPSSSKKTLDSTWCSFKCKSLTFRFDVWDLPGISIFLQGSSNIEKLVIHLSVYFYRIRCRVSGDEVENYWSSMERSFQHLFMQLKTIEIVGLDPKNKTYNYPPFQFAEFLLQKASVLEKMVIHKFPGTKAHDYHVVAQKFLRFRRCSPNAEVILPE